jgi:acyl-CoA thioester hydrolase
MSEARAPVPGASAAATPGAPAAVPEASAAATSGASVAPAHGAAPASAGTSSVFRTTIAAEWIDYNAHLRDAYYSLIFSLATDALMDRIGLDETYRKRTRNTLYTLEMHIHYLHEVKDTDVVDVSVRILGTDRKRIHAAFDMYCARYPDPVSTAEMMLLHVHQGDEVKSEAFPPNVIDALAKIAGECNARPSGGTAPEDPPAIPGSRRMELRSR